jgi:hypothetical protein
VMKVDLIVAQNVLERELQIVGYTNKHVMMIVKYLIN